jgi:hypothetical protein
MTVNEQVPEPEAPPAPRRAPTGTAAVRILAQVTLLAIFFQFVLAGLGTFDTAHGGTFKDKYFTLHDNFALVIIGLAVVLFLVALITRAGRTAVWEALTLALAAGPLQHLLATNGTDHAPWVGSLHVLAGVLILVLDAHLAFPGIGAGLRAGWRTAKSSDAA